MVLFGPVSDHIDNFPIESALGTANPDILVLAGLQRADHSGSSQRYAARRIPACLPFV